MTDEELPDDVPDGNPDGNPEPEDDPETVEDDPNVAHEPVTED